MAPAPRRYPLRDYLEIRSAVPLGFSPDGRTVLVGANLGGTMQLHTVDRDGGPLRQVTDHPEPVSGRWLPDRRELLVYADVGGNEHLQIHGLDPDGDGGLRPVVVEPASIARAGGVTRDGRLLAYASNRRTGIDFDIWVHELRTGVDRMVAAPGGWCSAAGFSPDGRWLAVLRLTEKPGDNDLYLVDVTAGGDAEPVLVSAHDGIAAFGAPAWCADGSGFFFTTDVGREHTAVAHHDLASGTWRYVLDCDWDATVAIDWEGEALLVATNEDGRTRARLLDPSTLAIRTDVVLPGDGVAGAWSFSHDGLHLAYAFTSATEPGDVWRYDLDTDTTVRLTDCPKAVPPAAMVEPELHRFVSFDGEEVPVFTYSPPAPAAEPPPVVAWLHGGPESQFVPSFNPVIQYLVGRGYAVAAPNVRGSTGYGKRWEHLDDVERRLDSVADLAALHDWYRETGRFDPGRAVLWGGSYGGYLVLAGLALQPDRWAAGVDVVGISSLVTFLENTAPWRRRFREREYGSLEHDRDVLVAASPITHVDAMRAPLFIVHGANDPRVPLGEAEQIHEVLSTKGVRTELAVYHDEGHGLARLENRLDAYPRAVAFLDEVLGLEEA
jgi:dipeptidyl aminopeptidase/acylaminoacyl peptidase